MRSVSAEHRPFLWTSLDDSVTGEVEMEGSSGKVSGVVLPRLVVKAALIREVGIRSDGEVNSSNNTDVLIETPRLVLRTFGCLLDDEEY